MFTGDVIVKLFFSFMNLTINYQNDNNPSLPQKNSTKYQSLILKHREGLSLMKSKKGWFRVQFWVFLFLIEKLKWFFLLFKE